MVYLSIKGAKQRIISVELPSRLNVVVMCLRLWGVDMTTADYALIVALASIFISLLALAWNVWQKFIFVKPSLSVSFGVFRVLQSSNDGLAHPTDHKLLNLTVTNMGPGPVVLYACVAKARFRGWKEPRLGMLNPIHGDPTELAPSSLGPFSAGLPLRIDAGDTKTFYFPYARETFLEDGICCVGVNDTYRRYTWCRRSDMRKVNAAYRRDFSDASEFGARGT